MGTRAILLAGVLTALFSLNTSANADLAEPDPTRFTEQIEEFIAWDQKNAVPANPVLFVGSSSIRLWKTANAFPGLPVINRGFGGSQFSDLLHYYDQLVQPYKPSRIFVYEGDNDIAHGKPAGRVLADFQAFAERVRRDFPDATLVFLSIKPSKARWQLWPEMAEANRLVREYTENHRQLAFANLSDTLLDAEGLPGPYYVDDGLHLNEDGYLLWQRALAPFLGNPKATIP